MCKTSEKENELLILCKNVKWLKEQHHLSVRQLSDILEIGEYSVRKLLSEDFPPRLGINAVFCAAESFGYPPYRLFTPLYE